MKICLRITYNSSYKFNWLENILIEYNYTPKHIQRGQNIHTFANDNINKKQLTHKKIKT